MAGQLWSMRSSPHHARWRFITEVHNSASLLPSYIPRCGIRPWSYLPVCPSIATQAQLQTRMQEQTQEQTQEQMRKQEQTLTQEHTQKQMQEQERSPSAGLEQKPQILKAPSHSSTWAAWLP
mmetsp:Transcript_14364/g.31676  ORF Transcript_14364/g.31676 Transcript_14364/m.31676 type:complete len:122 (+) Transcript_14364:508-873(+)